MNFLPARIHERTLVVAGHRLGLAPDPALPEGELKLGIRPEYVALTTADDPTALPAIVTQALDIGTHVLLTGQCGDLTIKARLSSEQLAPVCGDTVWLGVFGSHTCFYKNEELLP